MNAIKLSNTLTISSAANARGRWEVVGLPINEYDWELKITQTAFYAYFTLPCGDMGCYWDEAADSPEFNATYAALGELDVVGEISEEGKSGLLNFIESIHNTIVNTQDQIAEFTSLP